MRFVKTLVALVLLAVGAATAASWAGVSNVAADDPHWAATRPRAGPPSPTAPPTCGSRR